jgi:hypothetical protein
MFDPSSCSLIIPGILTNQPNTLLPVRGIYDAELRIKEVATVNEHKAPELLATFNITWLEIDSHIKQATLLLHEAKKAANQRQSIVILDEVPKILVEKKLATARSPGGSEDQRNAILNLDKDYINLTDKVAQIECIVELLEGKKKAIEMAYTSVKKILGGEPSLEVEHARSEQEPERGPQPRAKRWCRSEQSTITFRRGRSQR